MTTSCAASASARPSISLLMLLRRSGEVRQRDLAELTLHDETSLTRSLRPLVDAGWVAVGTGDDRREKWLTITADGMAKLDEARPAWERAGADPGDAARRGHGGASWSPSRRSRAHGRG